MIPLLLLLLGCGEKSGDSACAEHDPPLDWARFGQGLMASQCTGCHHSLLPEAERSGAPLGVDFDTEEGVQAWREEILSVATPEDATMPPSGPLEAELRAELEEWLSCSR